MRLSFEDMELIESALEWEAGRLERVAAGYDDPKPLLDRAKGMRALMKRISKPLDAARDETHEKRLMLELSKVRARIKSRKR